MRLSFMIWLREKVFKVPEGIKGPKILWYIYWIIYPLRGLYENQSGIHYDPSTDIYKIRGMEFTGESLRYINNYGLSAEEFRKVCQALGKAPSLESVFPPDQFIPEYHRKWELNRGDEDEVDEEN